MDQLKAPLLSATLYVVLMALTPLLGEPIIVCIMFIGLPFILIWLAVRVLRDGTPSSKSFEDQFYEDYGQHVPVKNRDAFLDANDNFKTKE